MFSIETQAFFSRKTADIMLHPPLLCHMSGASPGSRSLRAPHQHRHSGNAGCGAFPLGSRHRLAPGTGFSLGDPQHVGVPQVQETSLLICMSIYIYINIYMHTYLLTYIHAYIKTDRQTIHTYSYTYKCQLFDVVDLFW